MFALFTAVLVTAFSISGAPQAQGQASTAVRPPISDNSLDNPNAYDVIRPERAPNQANMASYIQAHIDAAGYKPVFLSAGQWNVCSPVVIRGHTVIGASLGNIWTSGGGNAWPYGTVVTCPSGATFSNGDGFFQVGDNGVVIGVSFFGFDSGSYQVSCVDARSAVSIEIRYNQFYKCYIGIDRYADGSNSHGNLTVASQLAVIEHNYFAATYTAISNGCSSGGYVSDERIINNNTLFAGLGGTQFYFGCTYGIQFVDNRIEDYGNGVNINGGGDIQISGNMFDRLQGYTIGIFGGAFGVGITANTFGGLPWGECNYQGSYCTDTFIEIGGSGESFTIGPNGYNGNSDSVMKADGYNLSGTIYNTRNISFFDSTSDMALTSLLNPKPNDFHVAGLAGSTFSAPDLRLPNHEFDLASACACAIPNPSDSSSGTAGIIKISQSALTAKTVTWGSAYKGTIPTLSTTVGEIDYIPYVVSGSSVILMPKTTQTVSANLLAGGNGMTSGWAPGRASLTNGVGTDPLGGSAASAFKEDNTASNSHVISQDPISGGTSMTCSIAIHAGTSGTRQLEAIAWDSGYSGNAWAVFAQDGTNTASGHGGSETVSIGSVDDLGGGWHRVNFTFGIPSGINNFYLFMDNGSNAFAPSYSGDNTSNIWLWGPNCHA